MCSQVVTNVSSYSHNLASLDSGKGGSFWSEELNVSPFVTRFCLKSTFIHVMFGWRRLKIRYYFLDWI